MSDRNEAPDAADPVALASALIRCRSITPADDGALDVAARALAACGARIERLAFEGTPNLYAVVGEGRPAFCFAGHTDVVPPGGGWRADPFCGAVVDGVLIGRGACDMKGGVAAFLAALARHRRGGAALAVLLTGNEEGDARGGTEAVMHWLAARDAVPAFCLVGEPTSRALVGDAIKVGRRGSLSARITVRGRQGHVAYPERVDNPVHRLAGFVSEVSAARLDEGSDDFAPSSVQVTSFDVGNPAGNVVPPEARARLNIRFNDRHAPDALTEWLRARLAAHADDADCDCEVSAEPFMTPPGEARARVEAAIRRSTGVAPRAETGGGTSDARFIARYCPVVEFGLVGATMHAVDEGVPVADLWALMAAYGEILRAFDA